ncbi:hypothetical protein Tco_0715816 [Tanacetum coccineum]
MSTQQDIYDASFENRPPMLNKDNYVPWSSRLLRYAKSKPNGKLIYNSIMNGPYVRRMIPKPGDSDHEVPVAKTFHEQTDDEHTEKEVKQMEADDQAIQIILMGLLEDIYAAVDSCATAQEIWLRAEVNELRAERLARAHDPLAFMANSNNPYNYIVFHQDQPSPVTYMQQPQPNNNFITQPSFNTNYMQQPMPNPKDITDLTTAMNMALIAHLGMNLGQDRQMQMVEGNGGNQFRQYAGQNVGNLNGYNAVHNVGNQVVQNPGGLDHLARNCIVRPRRRDVAYLQTQLLIAQKEEAGI